MSDETTAGWTAVGAVDEVPEGPPHRAVVGNADVLIYRLFHESPPG